MFFDAKVLVLSRFEAAPNRSMARRRTISACEGDETLRIGRRVLREYLATVTRPQSWSAAISMDDAPDHIARLEAGFNMLKDGPSVTNMIATLCREAPVAGKQIHDANIVAAMIAHGERRLLTFNTADFGRYGEWIELADMEDTE